MGRTPASIEVKFMQQAIAVARRGAGFVQTNPLVGAVLVYRGKTIAQSYHAEFGGPHAERRLLERVTKTVSSSIVGHSTLYLTLEPCSTHHKKTPPCLPLLLASGIRQVVIGSVDPNPRERGRSIRRLRRAGIKVTVGVAQTDTDYLIRTFRKWITTKQPYVLAKVGMTLDGRITTGKKNFYITNDQALQRVHALRQEFDAMIVGVNTIIHDNPRLNTRLRGLSAKRVHHPIKIILDSHLRTPLNSQAVNEHTIIACRESADQRRKTAFVRRGADILELPTDTTGGRLLTGYMDVAVLLQRLGQRGISSVIIEGGANVYTTFINKQAIDEFYCFLAPQIFGATHLPFTYALDHSVSLDTVQFEPLGDNILVRGYARYH